MAVYAIGDVQGCESALLRLLDQLRFDPERDRLWFAGDLVNRGPSSLAVMRRVVALGERAVCVLGNHDLHLLAVAVGARPKHRGDRFDDVLQAPDRERLLDWLRRRPLLHHDAQLNFTLVHAGMHPSWDLATARTLASEAEAELRGPGYRELLAGMYGDRPSNWHHRLQGSERLRFIINCYTRMRFLAADGSLDLRHKGPPGSQPPGLLPWYRAPDRKNRELRILFGHWSTHGGEPVAGVYPLDTGCLWGGQLSALRLDGAPSYRRVDCARP